MDHAVAALVVALTNDAAFALMLPIHATDGPVLALSDIMHTLSPSPVPQPPLPSESAQPPNVHVIYNENSHPPAQNGIFSSQLDSSHGLSPSPEPLDYSDVELMRSRIHELGLVGSHVSNFNTSATERELANMVRCTAWDYGKHL